MSEVKFTEQELQSLQELSVKSNEITNRFGQLAIKKLFSRLLKSMDLVH